MITKICDAFFKTLLVVRSLHRPGVQAGDFHRSVLTDEHIFRPNIAYLFVLRVKELTC